MEITRRGSKIKTTVYCVIANYQKNTHPEHWTVVKVYSVNHDQVKYMLKFTFEDFQTVKDHQLLKVIPLTIGKSLRTQKNDLW